MPSPPMASVPLLLYQLQSLYAHGNCATPILAVEVARPAVSSPSFPLLRHSQTLSLTLTLTVTLTQNLTLTLTLTLTLP